MYFNCNLYIYIYTIITFFVDISFLFALINILGECFNYYLNNDTYITVFI